MRLLAVFSLLFLVIGLNACATKGVNLVKTGAVKVISSDSGKVKIVNIYIKQMENEVLIHADAKPKQPIRFFIPGHLSFQLLSAENETLLNLDVTRFSMEHGEKYRSSLKHVSFWLRMPMIIPPGSTLKVSHHESAIHRAKKDN